MRRNEKGGPTLSWWKTQQLLYDASGDVLTILDCCSAALASKGDKLGAKFEILGASAKGFRTPEPGKSSFTTILIKHIRKSLKKTQQVNARSLHGELLESSQLTGIQVPHPKAEKEAEPKVQKLHNMRILRVKIQEASFCNPCGIPCLRDL